MQLHCAHSIFITEFTFLFFFTSNDKLMGNFVSPTPVRVSLSTVPAQQAGGLPAFSSSSPLDRFLWIGSFPRQGEICRSDYKPPFLAACSAPIYCRFAPGLAFKA